MFVKQSTAYTFRLGPFLDEADGKTAETGLTISQADVRLSKAGGNFAQKNESSSSSHDEIGFYICVLDTTDTNTCGELLVAVHETGALPVFVTFQVVEEVIYDSLFATSAAAFDANQRVDVGKVSGDATAADNLELMYDGTGYSGGTAKLGVDVVKVSGDATAADNLESMYDGTGYAGGTAKLGVDVVQVSGDATAADNLELMYDGTGYAGGTTKLDVNAVTIEGVDATNAIQTSCGASLITYNLDHLMAVGVASNSDMTTEVVDGSVLSNLMSKTSDTSTFVVAADSLEAASDAWTTALTESYASDGSTGTPAQLLYMIWCAVNEFAISDTTITGKKLDGSTTAMTWTLDSASSPTSRTRAT